MVTVLMTSGIGESGENMEKMWDSHERHRVECGT